MVGLIFTLCLTIVGLISESSKEDAVIASVDHEPIYAREVERLQQKAVAGKKLAPDSVQLLQARLLEEIVNRRLVLASAKRSGEAAREKEIEQAMAELKLQLAAQRKTLDDFLKERSLSEKELHRQLAWNALWEKLLAKYATPERMQKYFESHRRDFDGTEISVSHILLKPAMGEKEKGEEGISKSIARAKSLRKDLLAGTISFSEAAKKFSVGTSHDEGGELGFIGRRGPMDNAFSRAAFALNPGEISSPVRTSFGVHLIRCDEIRAGKKQLAEVETEVRDALARELLEKLAQAERPRTPVEYVDNYPHLDPASHILVKP